MKKLTLITVFFLLILKSLTGQGFEILTGKINNSINSYFKNKTEIKYSIVKFQNNSILTDIEGQKFYQLLVSKLELNKNLNFIDLLLDFNKKNGVFNLNRVNGIDYSVYINLTNNKNKIGSGIVVYSRDLEKIVFVKYFETLIKKGERDLLKIKNYGFKDSAFVKFFEINLNNQLLDVCSINGPEDSIYSIFYYFDKVEIYKHEGKTLKKKITEKLLWERPFFPVIKKEGKLFSLIKDKEIYFFVGGNFSSYSRVFSYDGKTVNKKGKINFIPFSKFTINNIDYLAGSKYASGKNFFLGKIFFMALKNGKIISSEIFIKKVPEFFSAIFGKNENNLNTFSIIDKNYLFKRFTQDFNEKVVSKIKYGFAAGNSGDNYIGLSGYTMNNDILNIMNVDHGIENESFKQDINGSISFISKGIWNEKKGLWILIERNKFENNSFHLQFWGRNKK
ncbi:MAG: hypothetical protein ABFR75_01340 [Acidobacteriota bacterium]